MIADPGPGVLADLLVIASEDSAERLVTTHQLLRELVGPDPVNRAHQLWTDRSRGWVNEFDQPGPCWNMVDEPDVFDLTRRLRATTPGRRR